MNEKNPLAKQLSVAGLAMVLYAAASFTGNFLFLGVPSGFEYSPTYGRLTYTDGEPLDHEEVRLTFGSSAESVGKNQPGMSLYPRSATESRDVGSGLVRQAVGHETARIL